MGLKKVYFDNISDDTFEKISSEGQLLYSDEEKYVKINRYVCDEEMVYVELEVDNGKTSDSVIGNLQMDKGYYCINNNVNTGNMIAFEPDDFYIDGSKIILFYKTYCFEGYFALTEYSDNLLEGEVICEKSYEPTVKVSYFENNDLGGISVYFSEMSLFIYGHGTSYDKCDVKLEKKDGTKISINSLVGPICGGTKDKGEYIGYEFKELIDTDDIVAVYINDEMYVQSEK